MSVQQLGKRKEDILRLKEDIKSKETGYVMRTNQLENLRLTKVK